MFLFFVLICTSLFPQGQVYLVIGSDTGMWEGLDTGHYNCYIKGDLYTVPERNGHKVMEDAFRNSLRDSYGGVMKLTWWMMSGNMFYYSINANTPTPNSMAPYLMNKYHGDKIRQFGDELSLHYHTYFWSNYNGTYYWNQAMKFSDTRSDFDYTLAQNLLDENMFPVSFRSGWHFMDNDWQNYLNTLLPYSLHNDWPAKKTIDTTEARDNVIDWSQAPSTWVPYHPSPDNYQLPGDSKGWNTRSRHIGSVSQKDLDSIFARASRGIDQLPCLWGHLPETDFLQNLKRVDSLVHISAKKFPSVKFRYCSAVEAYQRWLKTTDTTPPALQITEVSENGKVAFDITTDEEIFQTQPFFAVKDIYERYSILACRKTGTNSWRTDFTDRKILAKAGAAVTDLSGNLTKKLISYLPDDSFIDNAAVSSVTAGSGIWTKVTDHSCFDISYLKSTVTSSEEISLNIKSNILQPGKYNLFIQLAKIDKSVDSIMVVISQSGKALARKPVKGTLPLRSWVYAATISTSDAAPLDIRLSAGGKLQSGKTLAFDALKISPLVRDKELFLRSENFNVGDVITETAADFSLGLENRGTDPIQIDGVSVKGMNISVPAGFPLTIEGMQTYSLPVKVWATALGSFTDTLFITSDDPVHPLVKAAITGNGVNYYVQADNEEPQSYSEAGTWAFSNAAASGSSSRYAQLNQKPGARAIFTKVIERAGTYDFLHLLPRTVNSTNHALYVISSGTALRDSFYVDQNEGSGTWVKLTSLNLPAGAEVKAEIIDAGGNTNSAGTVIRADAVRFSLTSATGVNRDESESLPEEFALMQNYPNPFNPMTSIQYSLPELSEVSLKVYDVLGCEISTLFQGMQCAGRYTVSFNPQQFSSASGVYFYRLNALPQVGGQQYIKTMKMMYLK